MLLKGECVAALTEVLIVAQSSFQIDALHLSHPWLPTGLKPHKPGSVTATLC